jgi:hypothetical protein
VADGINLRLRRRDMNVFRIGRSTRTADDRSCMWRASIRSRLHVVSAKRRAGTW